jgi:hypothetical protein
MPRVDLALQIRAKIPNQGTPERERADVFRLGPKTTARLSHVTRDLINRARDRVNASARSPLQRVGSIDELLYFLFDGDLKIAELPPRAERPEIPMPKGAK